MKTIFLVIQIILSIVLTFLILLQGKGAGLDPLFGGSGTYSTRRGVEKFVFYATIVVAVLFFLSSIVQLLTG